MAPCAAAARLLLLAAVLATCCWASSDAATSPVWRTGGRALLSAPGFSARRLLAPGFFEATPCNWRPTSSTASPDSEGRLWGWENGRSCAFRMGSRPVFYLGYEPGSWVLTPACKSDPFAPDSVTDSMFKTWGWENSRLCAYKDDQLQPASISRMPTRLDWVDAPRCSAAPAASNSARDKLNRLWGWERHRNCAYKSAEGTPTYYSDYLGPRYAAPAAPLEPEPEPATPALPSPPLAAPAQPAQSPATSVKPSPSPSPSPTAPAKPSPKLAAPAQPSPSPTNPVKPSPSPSSTPATRPKPSPTPAAPAKPSPSPVAPAKPSPPPSPSPAAPAKPAASPAPPPAAPAGPLKQTPCGNNGNNTEVLAEAIVEQLYDKLAAATNGYESLPDLAQQAAHAAYAASQPTSGGEVAAAQAGDEWPPGVTPLPTVGRRAAAPRYTAGQVEALVDAPGPAAGSEGVAALSSNDEGYEYEERSPPPARTTARAPAAPSPSPAAAVPPPSAAPARPSPFSMTAAARLLPPLPSLAAAPRWLSPSPLTLIPATPRSLSEAVPAATAHSAAGEPAATPAAGADVAAAGPGLVVDSLAKAHSQGAGRHETPAADGEAAAAGAPQTVGDSLARAAAEDAAAADAGNSTAAGDADAALPPAAVELALPADAAVVGPTDGPTIVGDTLIKSNESNSPATAEPSAPQATAEAALSLAQLLGDGGPGGVSPPGTVGTAGKTITTALPPDANLTTAKPAGGFAAAEGLDAAPANATRVDPATASYSPGGVTPPGTKGSSSQLTLLQGTSGDFSAASADESPDYEPMGPTSRGGGGSRPAPGARLLPRPAEPGAAASPSPAGAAPAAAVVPARMVSPAPARGASPAPARTTSPAPSRKASPAPGAAVPPTSHELVAAPGTAMISVGSRRLAAAANNAPDAPRVEAGAAARAESSSNSSRTSASGARPGASGSSAADGAAAAAAARAGAYRADASSSNSSASASAAAYTKVTNPDGSYAYSWSNASSSSWRASWNSSWSAAWSEANATCGRGAAASGACKAAAAAAAAAGPSGATAGGAAAAGEQEAARRRLMEEGGDPWFTTKVCNVKAGGPNTVSNVTRDYFDRYWGFQDGGSCTFRGVGIEDLKYSQSAPFDSPTFTKAPACPISAPNPSLGTDGHRYAWDSAAKATCTFDKPHATRPLGAADPEPRLTAPTTAAPPSPSPSSPVEQQPQPVPQPAAPAYELVPPALLPRATSQQPSPAARPSSPLLRAPAPAAAASPAPTLAPPARSAQRAAAPALPKATSPSPKPAIVGLAGLALDAASLLGTPAVAANSNKESPTFLSATSAPAGTPARALAPPRASPAAGVALPNAPAAVTAGEQAALKLSASLPATSVPTITLPSLSAAPAPAVETSPVLTSTAQPEAEIGTPPQVLISINLLPSAAYAPKMIASDAAARRSRGSTLLPSVSLPPPPPRRK